MSPSTVRWGGITVFIGIALVIILPIVMVAMVGTAGLQSGGRNLANATAGVTVMTIVMNLSLMAVMVFVFYTTKGFFNALGYRGADIVIYVIIVVQVISAVVGSIMNTSAGMTGLMQAGNFKALGIAGIVVIVTTLVFAVALIVFAVLCFKFGKFGGGLWTATGVLYLIGVAGILIGVVIMVAAVGFALSSGSAPRSAAGSSVLAMVLIVIAFLCYAAAIICHGIGLILGAGRMEREPNPVEAF